MIYLWEIPSKWPNKLIGKYDHDHSPNYLLFRQGQKIKNEELKKNLDNETIDSSPIVKFKVSKATISQFDCLPNSGSAPLVNERLKQLLEKLAPNDVEFFPAILECSDGELEGYYCLNITTTIKGIDHEKSIYTTDDENKSWITGIHYLTYLPNCMGEHKFARDEEYHGNLLVREDAAKAFEEAKITGVRLVRPEDYYHRITAWDLIESEKNA